MIIGKDGKRYHHAVLYPRKGDRKKQLQHPIVRGKRRKGVCCYGCKHDMPGGCSNRYIGDDGYFHLPAGDCYKA